MDAAIVSLMRRVAMCCGADVEGRRCVKGRAKRRGAGKLATVKGDARAYIATATRRQAPLYAQR